MPSFTLPLSAPAFPSFDGLSSSSSSAEEGAGSSPSWLCSSALAGGSQRSGFTHRAVLTATIQSVLEAWRCAHGQAAAAAAAGSATALPCQLRADGSSLQVSLPSHLAPGRYSVHVGVACGEAPPLLTLPVPGELLLFRASELSLHAPALVSAKKWLPGSECSAAVGGLAELLGFPAPPPPAASHAAPPKGGAAKGKVPTPEKAAAAAAAAAAHAAEAAAAAAGPVLVPYTPAPGALCVRAVAAPDAKTGAAPHPALLPATLLPHATGVAFALPGGDFAGDVSLALSLDGGLVFGPAVLVKMEKGAPEKAGKK